MVHESLNCVLPGAFVPLRSLLSLMVCAKVEFFLQSCLRFILMTYISRPGELAVSGINNLLGQCAMRTMLHFLPCSTASPSHICMEFAMSHSLVFNTAETQLIYFSQKLSTVNFDRVNLAFLDSALTFN